MTGNFRELESLRHFFLDHQSRITVLTGAGISAESGIPTFRGPEGYWTVGSKVYMPQEMATLSMFRQQPLAVWQWYLYRLGVCLHAEPNAGHYALAQMEQQLAERFGLISQNIDNLHIRAGNSLQRTLQIHGNINHTRCSAACTDELRLLPDALKKHRTEQTLTAAEIRLLHCPDCDAWLRPHVLWFDEYYDEEFFRYESSMALANKTDLLISVGTSGATTLPNQVAMTVHSRGQTIVDINPEANPFSELAGNSPHGMHIRAAAAVALPQLAQLCTT